ncbi:MAG: hypothetical protein LH660_18365 [Phormidesmis sp. CAN_BIN36]|nr:hypothetical protein [Phormidesmis sp. CAN_BIN36]
MTSIPFPGYHPGTDNDEIHTDFAEQHIFEHEDGKDEFTGVHGALKRFVADGQMWYVLLHTTPVQYERCWFSEYVILFAVGRSTWGNRLLGVITHQA